MLRVTMEQGTEADGVEFKVWAYKIGIDDQRQYVECHLCEQEGTVTLSLDVWDHEGSGPVRPLEIGLNMAPEVAKGLLKQLAQMAERRSHEDPAVQHG